MRNLRSGPVAEKSLALRVFGVTLLSAFFALSAHLAAGGTIATVEGLGLGALSAVLVAIVALHRSGFWRVFCAMVLGQFAFHIFMGVGATSSSHHHHAIEPLVSSGSASVMGISHLCAAVVTALLVSEADRALRSLKAGIQALRTLAFRLIAVGNVPEFPRPSYPGVFHYQALEGRNLVGSLGLRGPPVVSFSA